MSIHPNGVGTTVEQRSVVANTIHPATSNKQHGLVSPNQKHPMVEFPVKKTNSVSITSIADIPPMWTTCTHTNITTYIHNGTEYFEIQATLNAPPTSAALFAIKTPVHSDVNTTIHDITAILWFDQTMLWGIIDGTAKCYIFVDSIHLKPKPWPRSDKIDDTNYKQVLVPADLFYTLEMHALAAHGNVKATDVTPAVRYTDKGKHKQRTFWVKMWKELENGYDHCHVSLVVIEHPTEPTCPDMFTVEPPVFQPFTVEKTICNQPPVLLSVETSQPSTYDTVFGIL